MKKSNILIATVAVIIAAASSARAEVRVDFDGSTSGTESFTEALKENKALGDFDPVPFPMPAIEPDPCYGSVIQPHPGPCDYLTPPGGLWPGWLPPGSCWGISSGPGWIGCDINPGIFPDYNGYAYDNKAAGIAGFKKQTTIPSRSEVAVLAGFYSRQAALKDILGEYFSSHPGFPADIVALIKNNKARILYDNTGMYIINERKIIILGDKSLVKSAKETGLPQNKAIGLDDVAFGVAVGCFFSNDCWNAIGDAVSDVVEGATNDNYNDPNDTSDHNCASQSTC